MSFAFATNAAQMALTRTLYQHERANETFLSCIIKIIKVLFQATETNFCVEERCNESLFKLICLFNVYACLFIIVLHPLEKCLCVCVSLLRPHVQKNDLLDCLVNHI